MYSVRDGKHMGSNGKQTSEGLRQRDAVRIQLSQGDKKYSATVGNPIDYVDIVGVTGSIPVAPTITFNGLVHWKSKRSRCG
jgi:hypothetical protein